MAITCSHSLKRKKIRRQIESLLQQGFRILVGDQMIRLDEIDQHKLDPKKRLNNRSYCS
jgi:hypothetical protein